MQSWGISLAVSAGLFHRSLMSCSAEELPPWASERKYEMDGCCDVTVTAQGHFIKTYNQTCRSVARNLESKVCTTRCVVMWSRRNKWTKRNLWHWLVVCVFPTEQLLMAISNAPQCVTHRGFNKWKSLTALIEPTGGWHVNSVLKQDN